MASTVLENGDDILKITNLIYKYVGIFGKLDLPILQGRIHKYYYLRGKYFELDETKYVIEHKE